jgi:leucyl aminopeptidase (aminopeptidase T)
MKSSIKMGQISILMEGARKLVNDCARVKPDERVLIITDTGRDLSVAYAFMQAAMEAGAEPVVITMKQREAPGEEPPPQVREAMMEADVILQATTTIMAYTEAKREACGKGARFAAMTGMMPEIITSPAVTDTDFEIIRPLVMKLGEMVSAAETAHITTERGTDLTMSLKGRKGLTCTSILDSPGALSGMPDLEVFTGPIEDSVNGTAFIDATISTSGLVSSPVTLTIEKGRVEHIEGGKDAQALITLLKTQHDPSVYQIAELGIGLNPNAQLKGAIIEDEGALGTVHIALGDNILMGGKNSAPVHIDMVMKDPTVYLDGKKILSVKGRTLVVASDLYPLAQSFTSSQWTIDSL